MIAVANWVVAGVIWAAVLTVAAIVGTWLSRRAVAAENRRIDDERMRRHLARTHPSTHIPWMGDGEVLARRILAELDRDDGAP